MSAASATQLRVTSGIPSVRTRALRAVVVGAAATLWFVAPPDGLTPDAWRLFVIFASAILSVVLSALPILTASVFAVAAAVLTGLLAPARAYAGFANGTILLIVVAFLVARAVVKCGLGARAGYVVVSVFGRSTLGLSYSIFLVDALIAPAFPSNTARSGVIFPLAFSLAQAGGANPQSSECRGVGRFLMLSGVVSLSLSSALWLTAMVANPLSAEIARRFQVEMSFGTWVLASAGPTLAAMAIMPVILSRLTRPERTATPEAPAEARRRLAALGPLARDEKIVLAAFAGMVALWAAASTLHIDSTAVAFLGLGILLSTGVLTLADIAKEGDVLATFIWFAVLFTLSSQLNELGFMGFLGQRIAASLGALPTVAVAVALVAAYVVLHYVFVSQTAHALALFGVFLDVGIRLGVPAAPLAFQLAFANNYFATIAPQGSSANLLFLGSGFLSQGDLYRIGGITTVLSMVIYLVLGTAWFGLALR